MTYKVLKEGSTRRYYKYELWTQPVLISNTSSPDMWLEDPHLTGALNNSSQTEIETWGDSPMSYFNDAYKSMDSDLGNNFYLSADDKSSISEAKYQTYDVLDICFPQYMKISHIKVVCDFQEGYHCSLNKIIGYTVNNNNTLGSKLFNVYGSNTNTTLESDIDINHKTRKLRLCLRPDYNNGRFKCRVQEITITAQKIVLSNESDYDFYEEYDMYKVWDDNGTYKVLDD